MNNLVATNGSLDKDKPARNIINQSADYRVKSRAEISSILGKLAKNHTLLSIIVNGIPKVFGSMILEVNEENNYVVLDELYPRSELKDSLVDRKLSIETQLEGIEIRFSVTVVAAAARDEIEYYKVRYPSFIYHHQRRSSFRASVALSESLPVAMSTQSGFLLHAELRDISLGGLSALIKSPTTENLAIGDELPTCVIHAPDGKKIICSLEIARVEETSASQSLRIGVRFIHLSSADRHELSRLIARIDRENIKKIKRMPGEG